MSDCSDAKLTPRKRRLFGVRSVFFFLGAHSSLALTVRGWGASPGGPGDGSQRTLEAASFAKLCPLLPSCLLSPVTCAGEGVKLFVTASFCACGTTRQSPEGGRDAYVLPQP